MRKFVLIAAFALVASLSASPARADLVMRLTDGTNTVTITDGGVGDLNAAPGVLTASASVGAWTVNVSTGLGSPFYGPDHLDLNSVNATSAAGTTTTLTVLLTQTGNTLPNTLYHMSFGGTLSGGGTVTYTAFSDNTNAQFGTQNTIGTLGPFGNGSFNGGVNGVVPSGALYSLTERLQIVGGGLGTQTSFSGDAELLSTVPEPGTLSLLGTGLFGLARSVRRRVRKSKT